MDKIILFFLSLLLFSCGNSSVPAPSKTTLRLDSLEAEVMRVHDESMLGMSDIRSIKKDLAQIDRTGLEPEVVASIKTAIQNLVIADSLMYDWMHNYKAPERTDPKKAEAYYLSEYEKISKVDQLMNNSVEAGDNLFAEIKKLKGEQ